MIFAVAEAEVAEADSHHVLKAWSDLVVGDRPDGMLECYLLQGEGKWQIASVWNDQDSLNRALEDEGDHPAYVVFEAAATDPHHITMHVTGRLLSR